jgi:hypothetical protein
MAHSRNATSSVRFAQYEETQRLKQQLDAAERKIDGYAHTRGYHTIVIPMTLILWTTVASLYTELKQYRDTICASCKQKVLLAASLSTASPQQSDISDSRDTVNILRDLSGPIDIIAAHSDPRLSFQARNTGSEPSSPLLSPSDHESNSSIETHSDDSFHTASQSMPNLSNTSPDLPPSPTLMAPVEYNREIKPPLDLSVVSIVSVPAAVFSVTFSRDGRYFAVALYNEETHIYDMTTMSKR